MDKDVQRLLAELEAARQEANTALHLAHRARGPQQLDNVLNQIQCQLGSQRNTLDEIRRQIADAVDSMNRRQFLQQVGVVGVPAVLPASAICNALTSPLPTPGHVQSISGLRAAVQALWAAHQASRYDQLASVVPATLAALQHRNQEHNDAHALLSLTYQAVTGAMAKIGKSDLAWVAAERGIVAGKQSGSATVLAAAERMYAHALLAQDRNQQAQRVALDAASSLRPDATSSLAVYGACLNTTAIAAARQGDPSAHEYLDEAQRVAQHLRQDRNDLFTAFGRTNVGIHRVSASVELGEGGAAVEHASSVNSEGLQPERRAHFFIDLAQAHDSDEAVVDALLNAEEIAPEEVRYNSVARTLVASLLRARPTATLQALAERTDVEA